MKSFEMNLTKDHLDKIKESCKKHSVDKLYVFGSVLTHSFTPESDIDFLVRFDAISLAKYFDNYLDLKEDLASILKREIDLVEEQTLKNSVLIESIRGNQRLIYG